MLGRYTVLPLIEPRVRKWTPAPKQKPTLDAVGWTPTASVVSGDFNPRFFTSQTGDVNKGFRATGGIWTLVIFNWKKALNFKRQFYASIRRQWTANWWQCGGCWLCAEFYANKNSNAPRSYSHSVSDEQAAQFADILGAALKQGTYFNTDKCSFCGKTCTRQNRLCHLQQWFCRFWRNRK